MQFIANGPNVPNALVHAHEEGRVVFFCGAGISYPAGLPGFKGLVQEIYERCNTSQDGFTTEHLAFDRGQYDQTLGLLERRLPGGRTALRACLPQILQPDLQPERALNTHTALLRLARTPDDALRLVTTNFDRLFHLAAKRTQQKFQSWAAPTLPVPKKSRWDGLVFLHGLLPEEADDTTGLNHLVLTSGDFGLAYLTERWAARFASELFRNYVVCFVGYSINDPVLRYMMDALAADRMQGEITPQAWAFAGCQPKGEENAKEEWEAKGVIPILYHTPTADDHSALHKTLHEWAKTYSDGSNGKAAIVEELALTQPQPTTQDDFVGRMLWALSDRSGLPAKQFARINPAPPLEWLLNAFTQAYFGHSDLSHFDVPPRPETDEKLKFNLIDRPASYERAPRMLLASHHSQDSKWDEVMMHIAVWSCRHLNDPRLILWVAQQGGHLHGEWHRLIQRQLDKLADLERAGDTAQLDDIRSNAPNTILCPPMRALWQLVLGGHVGIAASSATNLYSWRQRFERDGLSTALRMELRQLLTPKVILTAPSQSRVETTKDEAHPRMRQLVNWDIVMAAQDARSTLYPCESERWSVAWPQLMGDIQQLLYDTLDLIRTLGEADKHHDPSFLVLPSIEPHQQNKHTRAWTLLIELLRDAWTAIKDTDPKRARRIAEHWFELPYPTFKRLALHAASQDELIPPEHWVRWLLADEAHWLWSVGTKREVCRLLVKRGRHLENASDVQRQLETAILAGMPDDMFRKDLDLTPDQRELARNKGIWLRLSKLTQAGLPLGSPAATRLNEIRQAHQEWTISGDERDEFSIWRSGSGDPDSKADLERNAAPRNRKELGTWLLAPTAPQDNLFHDTGWHYVLQTRFFHSLFALCDLADRGIWPVDKWRIALGVWSASGDRMAARSWRYAAPLVRRMPDDVIQKTDSLGFWLRATSKLLDCPEDQAQLIALCRRMIELPETTTATVAEALINLLFKRKPKSDGGIPEDLKSLFTQLCDTEHHRFRDARRILGVHLIDFFIVDRPWTEQHLLPRFSWNDPLEAKAVWEGFLRSPRINIPLLANSAFKSSLLGYAEHCSEVPDEIDQQFVRFLTHVALRMPDGYTANDFRAGIGRLPPTGLEVVARTLANALDAAGDKREAYWKNTILPFWKEIWPKDRKYITPDIAFSLARLSIAAGGEFPAALDAVKSWLVPVKRPDQVILSLAESDHCRHFPAESLQLLRTVADRNATDLLLPAEMEQCLNEIKESRADLSEQRGYRELRDWYERNRIR